MSEFGLFFLQYAPQQVGVIVFSPAWSTQLMELCCVPATSACLAPFEGLQRAARAGTGAGEVAPKGLAGLFDGIAAAAAEASQALETAALSSSVSTSPSLSTPSLLSHSGAATSAASSPPPAAAGRARVAALRRAKRRLVSAFYVADSLHRLAWRSGIGPVKPQWGELSKADEKRLSPALFQVNHENKGGGGVMRRLMFLK
jgi:hypothetical protein